MRDGGVKAIGLQALRIDVGWRLSGKARHKEYLYGLHWVEHGLEVVLMKTMVGERCWGVCVVRAIWDEAAGAVSIKVGLLRWAWGESHWCGGRWD